MNLRAGVDHELRLAPGISSMLRDNQLLSFTTHYLEEAELCAIASRSHEDR